MRDRPKAQGSAGREPGSDAILQELLNLISTSSPRQVARQFIQKMRPSPTLRRTMLNNLTGAVNMLLDKRDLDGAARVLEMAETVAEALDTPWALAECQYWRGRLELEQGHLEAAAFHFEKLSGIEDPEKQVIAIQSLALSLYHAGNLIRAEHQFHETIRVAQEHSSSLGIAQGYLGLAMIARMKNNVSEAKLNQPLSTVLPS